jgi:transitional endoplasmic reticulum ATPase
MKEAIMANEQAAPSIAKPILPRWALEIVANYRAGAFHVFLLDGNINDMELNPFEAERAARPLVPVREILTDLVLGQLLKAGATLTLSAASGLKTNIRPIAPGAAVSVPALPPPATLTGLEKEMQTLIANAPPLPPGQILQYFNSLRIQMSKSWQTDWKNEKGENEVKQTRLAVIIDSVEKLLPVDASTDANVRFVRTMIHSWATDQGILALGDYRPICILFADTRETLPADMIGRDRGICAIQIPLPSNEERERYFQCVKAVIPPPPASSPLHQWLQAEDTNASQELAQLTRGYRFMDCQEIDKISRAADAVRNFFFKGSAKEQVMGYVMTQKNVVIRNASRSMLEPMSPSLGFKDIGGLEGAKEYFRNVAKALLSAGEKREVIPKGVLLAGPPGTGKSVLAKALARETGVNLVRMGNIRSMWVGESERNLTLVLNLLKAMAPVIVFIDEIDQALGERSRGSGDSGVSGRIFQQILEFMGDNANRGQVIWIAATNRADFLDDAMVSRFDRIIPVLLPGSLIEWQGVINGIIQQLGVPVEAGLAAKFVEINGAVDKLRQHSGRSMETVLRLAYQEAQFASEPELTGARLVKTLEHFKININPEMYELQTLLAVACCNDTTFITKPGEGYSYGSKPLDDDIDAVRTELNNSKIEGKIDELKRRLAMERIA